ncbi:MAG: extracellular solute-binding protein [Spirochaetes bacterium]|nr:extracellular solute-binding protein [Spirochaetota bacterium]
MKVKKKVFSVILICVFLISFGILFASGGEKDAKKEGPVSIKIWDWQVMENYMAAYDEVLGMYESSHPNVTIERKAIASGEYEKQFKAALAGGEAPDLFQTQHGMQTVAYYEAGILHDFYPDWKADPEWQKLIDVNDAPWGDCWVEGEFVAFPVPDQWIHAIYYYKDMLDEYGLEKPETIDDWIAMSEVLKDNGIIPLSIAFGPNSIVWIANSMWNELMMQFLGGDVILKLQSGKISWEDPNVIMTLQKIKEMQDGGVFPVDVNSAEYFPDVLTRFQNKEAWSFYVAGDWTIGSMNPEDVKNNNIGVMPFPKVRANSKTGYGAAAGVLYGMQPDNPNKEIVIDIIKFMLSKEAAGVWIKHDIHATSKLAGDIKIENNLMNEVIKESTNPNYFYTPYIISSHPEIGRRQVDNLGKLFTGMMTAEEACADLEQFTKEQLGK